MDRLDDNQLELLAQALEVKSAKQGDTLVKQGDETPISLYLLSGRISLISTDGRVVELSDELPQAIKPIAQLLPRKYTVKAASPVEYITVDNRLLEGLEPTDEHGITASEVPEEDSKHTQQEMENLLAASLHEDLKNNCLKLPSLPDVAMRVGKAMRDETTDARTLAKIIQSDPAITTKLIKASNSPLYAGVTPVDTCSAAVVRLGSDTTHKLVLTFALRELFKTRSPILKAHMQALWEHSIKISAICYVLAKITKTFDAEHALLAGLLHDVGAIAILSYAENFPEIANNDEELDLVIEDMRGRVGASILQTWEFPEDLVIAAEEAENWLRDHPEPADTADLVITAQLHGFIGSTKTKGLPPLDQVPAFNKMELGDLSPKMSILILDKAEEKISLAESLLRS
jgi:HD-like signal output (HDOD) protein